MICLLLLLLGTTGELRFFFLGNDFLTCFVPATALGLLVMSFSDPFGHKALTANMSHVTVALSIGTNAVSTLFIACLLWYVGKELWKRPIIS